MMPTAIANYQLRDAGQTASSARPTIKSISLRPAVRSRLNVRSPQRRRRRALSRIYQLTVVGSTFHDLSGLQLNGSGQAGSNLVQTGILGLPGVQVSPTTLNLTQGGPSMMVSIVLASTPTSNVVLTPGADPLLSVSPAALTFTTANWNIPQTVTVIAVNTGAMTTQMASLHSAPPVRMSVIRASPSRR